jgi:hypothetical protein
VKLGDVLSKAVDETAVLILVVTFFQTLDLLKELHVSWPQEIKNFFNALSTWLSLLSFNIEMFHAECTFAITFEQQWLLQLLSPFAFASMLLLCLGLVWAGARVSEYMRSHPKVWKRCRIVMTLVVVVAVVTWFVYLEAFGRTILAISVAVVVSSAFVIRRRQILLCGRQVHDRLLDNSQDDKFMPHEYLSKIVWLLLFYLTVSYVTLVKTAASVFDCVEREDGIEYMSSHPEIACQLNPANKKPYYGHENDVKYLRDFPTLRYVAGFFCVLYGFGVPIFFWQIMRRNKSRLNGLNDPQYRAKYGLLADAKRDDCYWWEVVVMTRKSSLAIATIILSPGANIRKVDNPDEHHKARVNQAAALFTATLLGIAAITQAQYLPYRTRVLNHAELISLASSFLILMLGLGCSTLVNEDGTLPGEMNAQKEVTNDDARNMLYLELLTYGIYALVLLTVIFNILILFKAIFAPVYNALLERLRNDAARTRANTRTAATTGGLDCAWTQSVARRHLEEALTRYSTVDQEVPKDDILTSVDNFAAKHEARNAVADLVAFFAKDVLHAVDSWESETPTHVESDSLRSAVSKAMQAFAQEKLIAAFADEPTLGWIRHTECNPSAAVLETLPAGYEALIRSEVWPSFQRWFRAGQESQPVRESFDSIILHKAKIDECLRETFCSAKELERFLRVVKQVFSPSLAEKNISGNSGGIGSHRLILGWLGTLVANKSERNQCIVWCFRNSLNFHRARHGRQLILLPPKARAFMAQRMGQFYMVNHLAAALSCMTVAACIVAISRFPTLNSSDTTLEKWISDHHPHAHQSSPLGWTALVVSSAAFGAGFWITTHLVLILDIRDWQQNCDPTIPHMPSSSRRLNCLLCAFICAQYMQYAVLTFRRTVPWWEGARSSLGLLRQVFGLEIGLSYSYKYMCYVSCFSIAVTLFWSSFDAESTRLLGSVVVPLVTIACMRCLFQPLVSCTYFVNEQDSPCNSTACFDMVASMPCWRSKPSQLADSDFNAMQGQSISLEHRVYAGDGQIHIAVVSALSLFPLWWMGVAICTYFAAHVTEHPTMPLSGTFALLNAQVRIAIAIVSDGLGNFHPAVVCFVVFICCLVELIYVKWEPPQQHIPLNHVRSQALSIAAWCAASGCLACMLEDPNSTVSFIALVVGVLFILANGSEVVHRFVCQSEWARRATSACRCMAFCASCCGCNRNGHGTQNDFLELQRLSSSSDIAGTHSYGLDIDSLMDSLHEARGDDRTETSDDIQEFRPRLLTRLADSGSSELIRSRS